jgi:hypothetical protein
VCWFDDDDDDDDDDGDAGNSDGDDSDGDDELPDHAICEASSSCVWKRKEKGSAIDDDIASIWGHCYDPWVSGETCRIVDIYVQRNASIDPLEKDE